MYAMLTGCLPYTVEPFNITALHAKMLENKMNPIPEYLSTGKLRSYVAEYEAKSQLLCMKFMQRTRHACANLCSIYVLICMVLAVRVTAHVCMLYYEYLLHIHFRVQGSVATSPSLQPW